MAIFPIYIPHNKSILSNLSLYLSSSFSATSWCIFFMHAILPHLHTVATRTEYNDPNLIQPIFFTATHDISTLIINVSTFKGKHTKWLFHHTIHLSHHLHPKDSLYINVIKVPTIYSIYFTRIWFPKAITLHLLELNSISHHFVQLHSWSMSCCIIRQSFSQSTSTLRHYQFSFCLNKY